MIDGKKDEDVAETTIHEVYYRRKERRRRGWKPLQLVTVDEVCGGYDVRKPLAGSQYLIRIWNYFAA